MFGDIDVELIDALVPGIHPVTTGRRVIPAKGIYNPLVPESRHLRPLRKQDGCGGMTPQGAGIHHVEGVRNP